MMAMILELRDAVSNIVSRPSDVDSLQSIAPNVENTGATWGHDEAATAGGEASQGLQGPINYLGKGANDGMPDAWAAAATIREQRWLRGIQEERLPRMQRGQQRHHTGPVTMQQSQQQRPNTMQQSRQQQKQG